MKETYYFPHDYNAMQDQKILCLLNKCGLAGLGAYWAIIELLHQQPSGTVEYEIFHNTIKMYYSFQNTKTIEEERNKQVFNICSNIISCGLLVKDGNTVTSERVQRNKRYRESIYKSRSYAGKVSANKRFGTSVQQKKQHLLNNEMKRNEIKGNENKEKQVSIPSLSKITYLKCVLLTDEEHKKLVERFGEDGTAQRIFDLNNGIMSKDYKYKSHYHTILSWERRNERTIGKG